MAQVGAGPAHHAARSIEAPQLWHSMSAVLVMRAIVWCSPQLGHCETSSKRCRQLTQRRRPGSWVGRSHGSPQLGHGALPSGLESGGLAWWGSLIGLIIAGEAGDEEAGGAVAVGAQLQAAPLGGGGEVGREGTEVVQPQRRSLAGLRRPQQAGDPLLVLA